MMTKRATIAAATAVFAFAAGAASASTYNYDIDRQTMYQWTGLGSQGGDLTSRKADRVYVDLDVNGSATGGAMSNVEVGGYALTANALGGAPAIDDFIGWCMDLFTNVKGSNQSLNVNYATTGLDPVMRKSKTDASRVTISAERVAKVENLFETNYPLLTRTNTTSARTELAGFQVAIWELLYETETATGSDLMSTGSFRLTGARQGLTMSVLDDVKNAANTFLGNLGGTILANYDFTYFTDTSSNPSQNLVTVTPPAVPLPAPALMLLGGLGALSLLRRRKS